MNISIAYDGRCPVCQHVVLASRLKERSDTLELLDVRKDPVSDIQGQDLSSLNFDQGFAVVVDGQVHSGHEGAHVLAGLTQAGPISFRTFQWLMKTESRSRFWYPIMKFGRRLLLIVLRIPRINAQKS